MIFLFYHKEVFFHPLFKLHKIFGHFLTILWLQLKYSQDRTERIAVGATTTAVVESEHACISTSTVTTPSFKKISIKIRKMRIIAVPRTVIASTLTYLVYCIPILTRICIIIILIIISTCFFIYILRLCFSIY